MKKPSIGLYVSGDEENIRNAVAALAGELSEKNQSIESLMETYLDIDCLLYTSKSKRNSNKPFPPL